MKLILFFVAVFIGCAKGNEDDFRKIDSIRDERPCLAAGGTCTIAQDCPKGHLTEQRGLCSEQRSQGVECCYGVSIKETRCQELGGGCMAGFCNPNLIIPRATDCPKNNKCCLLI